MKLAYTHSRIPVAPDPHQLGKLVTDLTENRSVANVQLLALKYADFLSPLTLRRYTELLGISIGLGG
jgi:hypothetical protein